MIDIDVMKDASEIIHYDNKNVYFKELKSNCLIYYNNLDFFNL